MSEKMYLFWCIGILCSIWYLFNFLSTRIYVTTFNFVSQYIITNQIGSDEDTAWLLMSYTIRRCRSRDTSSASSNWNATASSSDGKAILWNLKTSGDYEIMVSCRDEMSGESMFSRSILTKSRGKSVFTNYGIKRNIIINN